MESHNPSAIAELLVFYGFKTYRAFSPRLKRNRRICENPTGHALWSWLGVRTPWIPPGQLASVFANVRHH